MRPLAVRLTHGRLASLSSSLSKCRPRHFLTWLLRAPWKWFISSSVNSASPSLWMQCHYSLTSALSRVRLKEEILSLTGWLVVGETRWIGVLYWKTMSLDTFPAVFLPLVAVLKSLEVLLVLSSR